MFQFLNTLRRLWRTQRWLKWCIYALPVLAVLVLLGPALGVVNQILKLVVGFLLPLVKSSGGRFFLVNLLVGGMALVVYWKGRARLKSVFAFVAMRHFLKGMQFLTGGFIHRAVRSFKKVVRINRFVNLETSLPAYREIAADAKVRLAMCYIRLGEADQALKWLELARKDKPPSQVGKTLREVRALAYYRHSTLARETAEKELEAAHHKDPQNLRLNRALLEKAEAEGDEVRALDLMKRIFEAAEGRDRDREARRLVERLHARAAEFVKAGELGRARSLLCEARKVLRYSEPVQLLLGDVELERCSPEAALHAWRRVPGPAARTRVAGLLTTEIDPRTILKHYPQPDVLIDLATRLKDQGAHDQARRTLEKALAMGADPVEVEKVLGDLAAAAEDATHARKHYLKAITRMFGGTMVTAEEE